MKMPNMEHNQSFSHRKSIGHPDKYTQYNILTKDDKIII